MEEINNMFRDAVLAQMKKVDAIRLSRLLDAWENLTEDAEKHAGDILLKPDAWREFCSVSSEALYIVERTRPEARSIGVDLLVPEVDGKARIAVDDFRKIAVVMDSVDAQVRGGSKSGASSDWRARRVSVPSAGALLAARLLEDVEGDMEPEEALADAVQGHFSGMAADVLNSGRSRCIALLLSEGWEPKEILGLLKS
jgi:hypothetical protein